MATTNKKLQKIMTQPINQIFRFFTNKTVVQIWLYDKPDMRIEGIILGFDEYMNMVLDQTKEISVKKNIKKELGKILLKGDTITLIMEVKDEEK
ncbi:putative small nuclear ribonucleoprotein E [Plasmodium gaboni]|uniref:Small nuclear ribonucleoprotein E n=1 Tax=Plasmodium gaboni TaxID=647221 RepID=A0A151LE91_9APIC|nr:putative small nuclear ribonucleoprotein E [Plasmodium gaboni]KYN97273.1 putative small nuclear ribonucleoprotein E [Plasmodium gaboni]